MILFSLLFIIMIFGIIFLSSFEWIYYWIRLEILTIFLIPVAFCSTSFSKPVYIIKYFIIQLICSSFLFLVFIINLEMNFFLLILLVLKLGLFPFYGWIIKVIPNVSSLVIFIIITWQKLFPFILLLYTNFTMLTVIGLISILSGAVGGIIQKDWIIVAIYSSVNHGGWLIVSILCSINLFIAYFIFYSIIIYFFIFLLSTINKLSLRKISIFFFSLIGIPPFLLFWVKWRFLFFGLINLNFLVLIIFLLSRMLSLYFYINLFFHFLTNYYCIKKNFNLF